MCFLQECLMPMAISLPDTVFSETQCSDAASRLNSVFSAQSHAVSAGDECNACPGRKAVKSIDEDFEAVLAWMMSGIVPADQSSATLDTAMNSKVVSGGVPAGLSLASLSMTTGMVTDSTKFDSASLNARAASMPPQSAQINANVQSDEGSALSPTELSPTEPQSLSTFGSTTLMTTKGQTNSIDIPVVIQSDPTAASEAISQDAIDALERIGRSPDAAVFRTTATTVPESVTSVFTLPVTESSEFQASESSFPSIVATTDEALPSSIAMVLPSTGIPDKSGSTESIVESVKGQISSDSDLPESDNPGSRSSAESHSAVALSTDAVRSDLIPPSLPHALPELSSSISSEMRPTLSNQVSQVIMEHHERNGVRQNDSLTVRLDPPELGEMTIRLSRTQEGLVVRVSAREAVTMDMLFARGHEIESQLRGQQVNLRSLEFLQADTSGNQYSQGQQQSDSSHRSGNSMNQVRRGSRNSSPANADVAGIATPDPIYGLSFTA